MFVRDFAALVRDACTVPEYMDVVLCDAETGAPHKGRYWIMPNTALQIMLVQNEQPLTKTSVQVVAPKPLQQEADKTTATPVHVALEYIMHPAPVAAMAVLDDHKSPVRVEKLQGTTLRECEHEAIELARQYRMDQPVIVHAANVFGANDIRWLPLHSDTSTRLRKAAVASCVNV